MKDFFEDLYDEPNEQEGEPSFSFSDFKKWLAKNKGTDEDKKVEHDEKRKEELKEKFKKRIKDKLKKNKDDLPAE